MTPREVLALVHASDRCTPADVGPILEVDPSLVLAELQTPERLGVVHRDGDVWAPIQEELGDSVRALEAQAEDAVRKNSRLSIFPKVLSSDHAR